MTKERFYAAFVAYTERVRGVSRKTATTYHRQYLKKAGALASKDYLLWIAECREPHRQRDYVEKLRAAVCKAEAAGAITAKEKSNELAALNRLEEFICRNQGHRRWSHYGKDDPADAIRYEAGVMPSEQVPKLCETLEEEYSRILHFAKGLFGDLMDPKEWIPIPVILKKGIPDPILFDAEEAYLEKLRCWREERELTEAEQEILRTGKIPFVPLAFFRAGPNPHIEIYYQSVVWEDSFAGYMARMVNCLAHEYMHYLHYTYATSHGNPRPFRNKNLNEGMADFFGVMYSLYRGGDADRDVAVMRYVGWTQMLGSGLPYANALHFYKTVGTERLYTERFRYHAEPMQKLIGVLAATGNGRLAALRLVL